MGARAKSFQEEKQVVEIRAKLWVVDDAVIESRQKTVQIPEVRTKAKPFHRRILLKAPALFNEVRPHISSSFPHTQMRSPFLVVCMNCTSSATTKQTLENSRE